MTLSIENKLNLSLVWGIWKKDGALIFHLNRGRDELCWVMDMTRYLGNVPAGNMSSWGTLVPDTICFRRQLIFLGDVDSDVGVRAGGRAWCRGFSAVNRLTDGDDGRVCCTPSRERRPSRRRSVGRCNAYTNQSVSQSVGETLRTAGCRRFNFVVVSRRPLMNEACSVATPTPTCRPTCWVTTSRLLIACATSSIASRSSVRPSHTAAYNRWTEF